MKPRHKITPELREAAADICAIAASNNWGDVPESQPYRAEDRDAADLACRANEVAYRAWRSHPDCTPDTHWAEAEAMLRDGWTP